MKKYSKRVFSLFLVVFALLSMIGPTFAASAAVSPLSTISESSASQTKTVYGYTYKSTVSLQQEHTSNLLTPPYFLKAIWGHKQDFSIRMVCCLEAEQCNTQRTIQA